MFGFLNYYKLSHYFHEWLSFHEGKSFHITSLQVPGCQLLNDVREHNRWETASLSVSFASVCHDFNTNLHILNTDCLSLTDLFLKHFALTFWETFYSMITVSSGESYRWQTALSQHPSGSAQGESHHPGTSHRWWGFQSLEHQAWTQTLLWNCSPGWRSEPDLEK